MDQDTYKIQMVDLHASYAALKDEIDAAMACVIAKSAFVNGPQVQEFAHALAAYTGARYCIPCASGTDALQIALMSLDLPRGSEVIVPAFTYVATAEAAALLGLVPVMIDVDYDTFTMDARLIEAAITRRTRAVIPVHLFGQCAPMGDILDIARRHSLYVIEDNAQAIGARYQNRHDRTAASNPVCACAGTMGDIGCTSFFPSKNLSCFGDGGAMFANDGNLAQKLRMIANHGQEEKYCHNLVGCNSRLDTLQAAVLNVKLKYLDAFNAARQVAARRYTRAIKAIDPRETLYTPPHEFSCSTHVYHQYTLKIQQNLRDECKAFLAARDIPSMIYYPRPLSEQQAFRDIARRGSDLCVSAKLAQSVLSLPLYPQIRESVQQRITDALAAFYRLHAE